MKVEDIMNRDLTTIGPEELIRDAATLMILKHISGLPVVNKDNELIGIISEKDVLSSLFPNLEDAMMDHRPSFESMEDGYSSILNGKVEDIMTKNVLSLNVDDPCLKAASLMWLKNIRRVTVTRGKKLIGIISIGDVHREIFKKYMI